MTAPIEITLGDGSVVTGANLDDAFENLAKLKADSAATGQPRDESVTYTPPRATSPSEGYMRGRARRRKRVVHEDLSLINRGGTS